MPTSFPSYRAEALAVPGIIPTIGEKPEFSVNETEQVIAEVWAAVLKRPLINISDNFFNVGGNSLLVAVVVKAITERLKVKVCVHDLYQNPVLELLAALLKKRKIEIEKALPKEEGESYIALQEDVYLASGTTISTGFEMKQLTDPAALFITGVTGFIGVHLLQELLHTTKAVIYCLVPAQDEAHAMEKISNCLQEYEVSLKKRHKSRIVPVVGDLSKIFLGLSEKQFGLLSQRIDVIYHSDSAVNFIEPYSYTRSSNVDGLREIIRLAGANRPKCLALLSTISVYSWGHLFTHKTIMNEQDDIDQNLLAVSKDIGYVRSKWVMESIVNLAENQGLPVITYRLGYTVCHSKTGVSAPGQWWAGLIKNSIESESYPLLPGLREGLVTVDYVTKAIAHISRNEAAIGRKFNLIPSAETNLTLEDFFGLIKKYYPFKLEGLPYKTWRKQWENDSTNPLFPLISLFKDNMYQGLSRIELYQHTYAWDCKNTTDFLKDSKIKAPVFNKELLNTYLNHLGISTSS